MNKFKEFDAAVKEIDDFFINIDNTLEGLKRGNEIVQKAYIRIKETIPRNLTGSEAIYVASVANRLQEYAMIAYNLPYKTEAFQSKILH